MTASAYHAHVYFHHEEVEVAAALQSRAKAFLAGLAEVHPPVPRPVGPHHAPMFEIDFDQAQHAVVVDWLQAHRGHMTVLVHPVADDEVTAHTRDALWLGERLPLDLSKLS